MTLVLQMRGRQARGVNLTSCAGTLAHATTSLAHASAHAAAATTSHAHLLLNSVLCHLRIGSVCSELLLHTFIFC